MTQIIFDAPEECPHCGSKNFKIQGDIYKDTINWTHVALKCMRCGALLHSEPEIHLVTRVR